MVKSAEELGTWDGDYFTYHEPIMLAGGLTERIYVPPDADLGPGITRDMVVEALANTIDVLEVEQDLSMTGRGGYSEAEGGHIDD